MAITEAPGALFKRGTLNTGLSDNRHQCSRFYLSMVRHRHGNRVTGSSPLHDDMTAFSSDFLKSMLFKQPTNFPARENL